MSSHHIVRDEQEPAIVITDWHDNYWHAINQLLGWTPTVVVVSDAVEQLLSKGIKVDVVVGSSIQLKTLANSLADQQPVAHIIVNDKSELLHRVMDYLIGKKYKSVNVFGGFTPDQHTNSSLNVIWYDANSRYVQSKQLAFKKWMPKGATFGLHPDQPYELTNAARQGRPYHVSNEGMVNIKGVEQFWMSEPYSE